MDVSKVLECLNRALMLQQRSVLQFTMGAGSIFGLEYQAVGTQLWEFARHELEDTKLLVEKITALDGDPTVEVGALRWSRPRTRRSRRCTRSSPTPARSRARRRSSTSWST